MKRRLLNILALLSLLLCAGAVAMDWRSRRAWDSCRRDGPVVWEVRSMNGRVIISRSTFARTIFGQYPLYQQQSSASEPAAAWNYSSRPADSVEPLDGWKPSVFKTIGMEWRGNLSGTGIDSWWLRLRWSTLAAAAAVLPAMWAAWRVRRALFGLRTARGLCPRCGYDLRATPDRCPECGHVPAAAATTGVAAR